MQEAIELALHIVAVDLPTDYPVLTTVVHAALLLYLAESTRLHDAHWCPHPTIRHAQDIIKRRAAEHIGVADLARMVGTSPEHLARLFQRFLGVTPGFVLREERLRLGMQLLEHTGLSVAEVAARSGFGSPQHFARLLKQTTSMTPMELRHRSWSIAHSHETAAGPPRGAER